MADRMELDGNHPNHITASFYDAAGFAATVQIGHDDLRRLVAALDDHQQDTLIAAIEQTRARQRTLELLANRRADRQDAAARRREMRQELIDSRPPYRFVE